MQLTSPHTAVSLVLVVCVSAAMPTSGHQPLVGEQTATAQEPEPELPPGAVRLVSVARHGDRVAVCAEEPGPAIEHGTREMPRTRVWVNDGVENRQVGTAPGTCDPAWSADGERVAVAAPDGLWVLTADLGVTIHLVDTRHSDAPGDEAAHRILSAPLWAPDGSRLAFKVSNNATSWVEAVDALTGERVYMSEPETYEFSWGDDSTSLRFGSRVGRLP